MTLKLEARQLESNSAWTDDSHRREDRSAGVCVNLNDIGRLARMIVWIDCEACGRIDTPAHEFNDPEDMAGETDRWAWIACERCRGHAKLHLHREVKPAVSMAIPGSVSVRPLSLETPRLHDVTHE